MNFDKTKSTLQGALRERNFALMSCIGLTVANLFLVMKIFGAEEKWVLISQGNTERRIEVSSKRYSDDYLTHWANDILGMLLCVNEDSVDWKTKQVLEITTEAHGGLREKLQEDSLLIKKDKISTVFYPKKFTVNQSNQTVDVVGEHMSYFGKDSTPVMREKSFRLTWAIRTHGVVLLKDFREIKDEKK